MSATAKRKAYKRFVDATAALMKHPDGDESAETELARWRAIVDYLKACGGEVEIFVAYQLEHLTAAGTLPASLKALIRRTKRDLPGLRELQANAVLFMRAHKEGYDLGVQSARKQIAEWFKVKENTADSWNRMPEFADISAREFLIPHGSDFDEEESEAEVGLKVEYIRELARFSGANYVARTWRAKVEAG